MSSQNHDNDHVFLRAPTPHGLARAIGSFYNRSRENLSFVAILLTLWVTWIGTNYVVQDHRLKPRLDILFSNRLTEYSSDADTRDEYRHVHFSLIQRNRTNVDATIVAAHVYLTSDVYKSINKYATFRFFDREGDPDTIEGVIYRYALTHSTDIDLGTFDLSLKSGTYKIAVESDCYECDGSAEGTLTLNVP